MSTPTVHKICRDCQIAFEKPRSSKRLLCEPCRSARRSEKTDRFNAAQKLITAKRRAEITKTKPWCILGISENEKFKLRRKHDPEFRIRLRVRNSIRKKQNRNLDASIRQAIRNGQPFRKLEAIIGYTIGTLKHHLERQFLPEMSWESFLTGEIHIDHIVPLSSFDLKIEEEFRAAWALSNLRPLWASENVLKGRVRTHLI